MDKNINYVPEPTTYVQLPRAQESVTYEVRKARTPSAWLFTVGFTAAALVTVPMLDKPEKCSNPLYGGYNVFTNRAFLELNYTSVEFHKIHTGKYYETLSNWLQQFGIWRTAKAVNAKVRQVEAEYTKLLKGFQARKGTTQCIKLNRFLDTEFLWKKENRKGSTQSLPAKDHQGVPLVNDLMTSSLPGKDDNNVVDLNIGILRTGKERNLDPVILCLKEENASLQNKLARQKTDISTCNLKMYN